MQTAAIAAADWGTTSFRLWLLDRDGSVLAETRGDKGMAALQPAGYPAVLAEALGQVGAAVDLPALICGMAGAAQGWQPAPYIDLPADLSAVASGAVAVDTVGRDVRILPGLAQRDAAAPDVMRGEETLLLGATLARAVKDAVVCLPGTHSKWATVEGGRVASFGTAMTGEAFALLASQSTLSHFAKPKPGLAADPAFAAAVAETLADPASLLRALFSVRAGPLLFGEDAGAAASARLSGLLIGAELVAFREAARGQTVLLVASGGLRDAYATAFDVARIAYDMADAETLTRAGLAHAAATLWPERFRP